MSRITAMRADIGRFFRSGVQRCQCRATTATMMIFVAAMMDVVDSAELNAGG